MVQKLLFYFILPFILNSCITTERSGLVNLIIYDDFINPKTSYDLIVDDFLNSGLIDSIKVEGRPIFTNSINFKIDTTLVSRYGIEIVKLDTFLNKIKKNVPLENIQHQLFNLKDGAKIPISAVCEIYLESVPHRPEIFLTKTDCYKFNNECVVKVVLYCNNRNKNKTVKFIQNNMHKYTDGFTTELWRYEIIKNELPENTGE